MPSEGEMDGRNGPMTVVNTIVIRAVVSMSGVRMIIDETGGVIIIAIVIIVIIVIVVTIVIVTGGGSAVGCKS